MFTLLVLVILVAMAVKKIGGVVKDHPAEVLEWANAARKILRK